MGAKLVSLDELREDVVVGSNRIEVVLAKLVESVRPNVHPSNGHTRNRVVKAMS